MRVHVLGICGTFMGGIALIAKQLGFDVSGSDINVYPPMSDQLVNSGINLIKGYEPDDLPTDVDYFIVGNVISRGNPSMEYILNQKIPFTSGPQWLAENVLKKRWVLAVSGTHGKTTTTSMLTWILEAAGLNPGYLVGGVPENFGVSARLGSDPFFVIEADEYDSAFFDKRSKFIHYHPKTLILNNLEYDHADIFADLNAIKQQFHYLVRTVPGNGLIIKNQQDENLQSVLEKGCWTPTTSFGEQAEWTAKLSAVDGSEFAAYFKDEKVGDVSWSLVGQHNVYNALAACAAAHHAGVSIETACASLNKFKNVKRRLEVRGQVNGLTLYDDFAHHPTAISTTLAGLRAKIGHQRIIAVLEFGSFTMRTGVHKNRIKESLEKADVVLCLEPQNNNWDIAEVFKDLTQPNAHYKQIENLVADLKLRMRAGDHIIVMSNSGFGGIHEKLLTLMQEHSADIEVMQ